MYIFIREWCDKVFPNIAYRKLSLFQSIIIHFIGYILITVTAVDSVNLACVHKHMCLFVQMHKII